MQLDLSRQIVDQRGRGLTDEQGDPVTVATLAYVALTQARVDHDVAKKLYAISGRLVADPSVVEVDIEEAAELRKRIKEAGFPVQVLVPAMDALDAAVGG